MLQPKLYRDAHTRVWAALRPARVDLWSYQRPLPSGRRSVPKRAGGLMLVESNRDGRLLRLALNRPEKRNALNIALCRELVDALEAAQADPEVGAVLLTGNGKAFCAGMDLSEITTSADDLHDRLFTAFAWLTKPLIADVRGPALAGGTGLVANAHLVFASEDATFGLTEIRIGLWPFLIFRAMLHALGERRAVELSLSGRTFSAREAEAFGLVHYVNGEAEQMARRVAESDAAVAGLSCLQASRGLSWEESGRLARRFRQKIFESEAFLANLAKFRR